MRTYFRLALTCVCGLAAFGGPVLFLEDSPRAGYLLGGLVAAILTWALLGATVAAEQTIPHWLHGVLGAGAALLSWATISLVAVFDVIPHALEHGLGRFDPVWIAGGLAPLVILGAAAWRAVRARMNLMNALLSAIFRYSVPLFGVDLLARIPHLPKQYPWLFLFTGAMFLVIDALLPDPASPLGAESSDKTKV